MGLRWQCPQARQPTRERHTVGGSPAHEERNCGAYVTTKLNNDADGDDNEAERKEVP
jgi:hypothetical protein